MNHYQEITLIAQTEIPIYFIWQKLYSKLHLALVDLNNNTGVALGISLPEYRYEPEKGGFLGNKLRVFANSEAILQQLDLAHNLKQLTDYLHLTGIREVPTAKITGYAQYRRKHVKGSAEKLARRYAKRKNVSMEVALAYFQGKPANSNLPFVQLQSTTTSSSFRLFIEKVVQNEPIEGVYGSYGLSELATVPVF